METRLFVEIECPAAQAARWQALAKQTGVSLGELTRRALEYYSDTLESLMAAEQELRQEERITAALNRAAEEHREVLLDLALR